MPSYGQKSLNYQAANANGAKIMIGDVTVAYAQTTTHSIDAGGQQLYGIGSSLPQEIQQLRISPAIALEYFALTAQGIAILGTGQQLAYSLFNTQFDIHIVDGTTSQILYTYVSAVASSVSETLATNQVILDSVSFLAMDVLNNQGVSILNTNSVYSIPSLVASAVGQGGLGNP